MQTKNQIEVLIAKLFSGNSTPEERLFLSSWMNENKENRLYFNQLLNIWQVSHPAFDYDTIDLKIAETNILNRLGGRKRAHVPLLVWWQRVAAILIIPMIALMGYFMTKGMLHTTDTAYQEVFSPYGVRSKISLPDGSAVWLNSGSRLKYPVTFKSGKREVYLSGEAYFEVNSDKKNPFIVATHKLQVKATGTAFDVEAYAIDSIVAVTLVHGKVGINIKDKKGVELKPNQRICYNNNTHTYTLTEDDTFKWSSWKDGILAFRDDRMDYVFKRVSLMYNVDIVLKDSIIASQLYRATFEGESLDEILKLLKLSAPIRYKKLGRVKLNNGEYSKEKIEVYKE